MSESGAVGSWQARTYVGLPITSSGFEAAADVRGLYKTKLYIHIHITLLYSCKSMRGYRGRRYGIAMI